ncbi:penicillin-binding protein [Thioclava dalianensis]|uniref:Penicillin-binding protein 1A n=1 Tax=Thioclava dalianensis TaxID=1185766 RepID=A0A074U3W9_9RHOB|nr:PBP1A family penicillin-binding protein [Thioclava dalianensis]KEP69332.1 penicillin-binding protein [Thioclava dalianensis]SFN57043.1 penicillin-binding protein 1A [Thioclava dalianensis]
MIRFILGSIGGVFSWLVTGVFFAALTVGAIFWIYSRDLPSYDQLAQYRPKTISRIYNGNGRLIDEFAEQRRLFVPSQDIPDLVKGAFISAEDKNFYYHPGFDPRGIAAAVITAVKTGGRDVRGASTITQQVTKNLLLSSDRKIERKIKELILSSRIEHVLSKDRILELYLNEIYLGQNSYGVAAAAQTYFNKPLSELTAGEAAYLAALPKAPAALHPVRDLKKATDRRNYVLRRMFEDGRIDKATFEKEQASPLKTVQNGDYAPFRDRLPPRDYFTDEIRRQLSKSFGREEFFGGGLTIRATVNPDLQARAAKALQNALETYDRGLGIWRGTGAKIPTDQLKDEASWRAALDAVPTSKAPRDVDGWYPAVVLGFEGGSARIGIEGIEEDADGHWIPPEDVTWARKLGDNGKLGSRARKAEDLLDLGDVVEVRAMTKDSDGSFIRWTLRQVPKVEGAFMAMDVNTGRVLAMQGGFSYQSSVFNRATQAERQPGSNFKPFVYAAALDSGFSPETIVIDAPIEVNTPQGLWRPKNASNRYYGPTPMRTGLEHSRNLMTVRIAQEVGMDTIAGYAEKFGVYDHMRKFLANALGAQETTMFRLISAYAMFANGGERVEPTLVDRVQDRYGRTIYRHDQRQCDSCTDPNLPAGEAPKITSHREQMIDPITAYQMISLMQGVIKRGSGTGVDLPVPVAGKTGTTNDAKDVWFTGFTSNIVASCYMGYDNPRSLGRHAYGGTLCVPVFNEFMKEAVKEFGGTNFKVPPGGTWVKFNRFTGARLSDDATGDFVQAEYLRPGQDMSGLGALVVDGGFAMGSDLPLFEQGQADDSGQAVTTSSGKKRVIPNKANFGTLSAGGLY